MSLGSNTIYNIFGYTFIAYLTEFTFNLFSTYNCYTSTEILELFTFIPLKLDLSSFFNRNFTKYMLTTIISFNRIYGIIAFHFNGTHWRYSIDTEIPVNLLIYDSIQLIMKQLKCFQLQGCFFLLIFFTRLDYLIKIVNK